MSTFKSDYHFNLPEHLIAQYPLAERSASRLLCLDRNSGAVSHGQFTDLLTLVRPNDVLVFNNTKVIPARMYGRKPTGGQLEILVERIVSPHQALVHMRSSRSPKPGSKVEVYNKARSTVDGEVSVLGRDGALFLVEAQHEAITGLIERCGHMPLPPYIERGEEQADLERYQTVYAKKEGAVAAPTAGLHFTPEVLLALKDKGVEFAEVTLHVGAGTFQPVKEDDIRAHTMHTEWFDVSEEVVALIERAKQRGGRVIAVGTTSVRSLESASTGGQLRAMQGDTKIFIYPGYEFNTVDALITNFHLPESTLIMLVSALASRESVLAAYDEAVQNEYRFFSYGDAMFIA
jgi:S-adenosylmethionine:tRNA ribosyltransferase-isomerase